MQTLRWRRYSVPIAEILPSTRLCTLIFFIRRRLIITPSCTLGSRFLFFFCSFHRRSTGTRNARTRSLFQSQPAPTGFPTLIVRRFSPAKTGSAIFRHRWKTNVSRVSSCLCGLLGSFAILKRGGATRSPAARTLLSRVSLKNTSPSPVKAGY